MAFGLLTAIVVPENLTDQIDGRLLSMAAVFVWVFIEALLVAAFGTTLGKWLLGTKVRRRDTTPLTYSAALARSVKVWWWGIGIGLPLAQQVTMAFAYRRVKRDHMTSWDAEGGFVVLHEPISLPKAFVVASVLALELVVSIVAA